MKCQVLFSLKNKNKQMIHMKYQVLFCQKKYIYIKKMSAAVVIITKIKGVVSVG